MKHRYTQQPKYHKLIIAFQKAAQMKTNSLITEDTKEISE